LGCGLGERGEKGSGPREGELGLRAKTERRGFSLFLLFSIISKPLQNHFKKQFKTF
jgi:hypothetical protein